MPPPSTRSTTASSPPSPLNPGSALLELSRRLGVARGTVQARLDKLVARGVVRGFGPDVDPVALGYTVLAFTTLELAQGRLAGVIAHLDAIPEVIEAHSTTGPADLHVRVVARTNEHLSHILNRILDADGIMRTTTVLALATQIPARVLPLVAAVAPGRARPATPSASPDRSAAEGRGGNARRRGGRAHGAVHSASGSRLRAKPPAARGGRPMEAEPLGLGAHLRAEPAADGERSAVEGEQQLDDARPEGVPVRVHRDLDGAVGIIDPDGAPRRLAVEVAAQGHPAPLETVGLRRGQHGDGIVERGRGECSWLSPSRSPKKAATGPPPSSRRRRRGWMRT